MNTPTKPNRQTKALTTIGPCLSTLVAFLSILLCPTFAAQAQGTAFTYQGRLNDSGGPVSGAYDLRFTVYDAVTGGNQVGGVLTNAATAVSNGLFTVTLDFGSGSFTGADRWLEIGVVINGGGSFATLSPRQQITATPYAMRASAAGSADTANSAATAATATIANSVMASNISGTISSNNIGAGSITTIMLAAGAVGSNQLAAGAVTTSALADGAITAGKIATASGIVPVSMLTIPNPGPASSDNFGNSMAALGTDRVVIGAYGDNGNTGVAYLLSATGALLATFNNPGPTPGDRFGCSVAAVGSSLVLIGAYGDPAGAGVGAAYLFNTNGTSLMTFNDPPSAGEIFGWSVAGLGSDRVLIGAPFNNTGASTAGAVYLFSTNGTLLTTFNHPFPFPNDHFGNSVVAVGSDRVLIGAHLRDTAGAIDSGVAYLFNTNGGLVMTFTKPTPATGDSFGWSVAAMGSDRVLIGAPANNAGGTGPGVAYLFGTNGVLLTTFTNPVPVAGGQFGYSVTAVGSDRVLIGADGDNTGAGAAGAAYLFSTNGVLLTNFTNPAPASGDNFGWSVAALGDRQMVIGAPNDDMGATDSGAAYLFTMETYAPGLIADGVRDGSITSRDLADGSVTTRNLADGAVTAGKIGGVLAASQIPNLDASKITSGTFSGNGAGLTNVPGVVPTVIPPGASVQMQANKAYEATNASAQTVLTLPVNAAVGDVVRVYGVGAGGWRVDTGSSQSINGYSPATVWMPRDSDRGWQSVASSSDGSKLAAVAVDQAYTSTDGGTNWTPRAASTYWISVASSADGSKLAGAVYRGQLYTSTDSGTNWTARAANTNWTSVASSADGSKLVATVLGGQIFTSTDSGTNWTPRASGQLWQSAASSSDGSKLVVVTYGGQIFTSTDSGINWTARDSFRNWYAVASSADGSKLVAVAAGGQIYTSTDSGTSWTARDSVRNWYAVGSSADGSKLIAAEYGGQIYISSDGGTNWAARNSNRYWFSVAASADGSRLVAAVQGGQIYVSSGVSWASVPLTGPQGSSIELQYAGSGVWQPLNKIDAANLTGTVSDTSLSINVPLLSGAGVFTGSNQFAGAILATNMNNRFAGNGGGLTNLNATNLLGILADQRLSTNVALLNTNQTFAGSNIFSGVAVLTNANNTLVGTYFGNGSGLTNLAANVALLDRNPQIFSGTNLFGNRVGIGTASPAAPLHVVGTNGFPHVKVAAGSTAPFGAFLSMDATATTGGKDYLIYSTGGTAGEGLGRLVFKNQTDNLTILTLSTNGNVGIGTNIPQAALHVIGNILASGTFTGNGGGLTNLSLAGLPAAVALLNANQTFSASNIFSGVALVTNANNTLVGSHFGNGAGLTNLSLAGLPTTVVTNGASGVTLTGTFSGNGGGLTNLNPANLVGTVADAQLTGNVALRTNGNTFAGNQIVTNGNVGIGTTNPLVPLHVVGTNNFPHVKVAAGSNAPYGAFLSIDATSTTNGNDYLIFSTGNSAGEGQGKLVFENITDGKTILTMNTNANVGIGTTNPTNRLHVIGGATFSSGTVGANQDVVWVPGNAGWSFTSDRNTKDRVEQVNSQSILEKVARMPINEWSYIGYDQRHIGPMAQDFHAQFPLNENDKALNDADLHGVALAAIQGLNQKLEQKETEITELKEEIGHLKRRDAENAELRARMEKLEALLNQKLNGGGR